VFFFGEDGWGGEFSHFFQCEKYDFDTYNKGFLCKKIVLVLEILRRNIFNLPDFYNRFQQVVAKI
jgi:hypothetical protein